MNNVSRKKVRGVETNPSFVEPPPIPFIKETSTGKSDGDYVKLNLRIDTTSSMSDLYEFRMSLFDHGERGVSFVREKFQNDPCTLGTA